MKNTILCLFLLMSLTSFKTIEPNFANQIFKVDAEKIDIKIKNDSGDDVKVINAGSGGSYSLTKGATTTIKMEEGDKLHYYDKGKKGALLLIATSDMHGKVQLLSKL